jgi:sortase A
VTRTHIQAIRLVALTAGLALLGTWAAMQLDERAFQHRAAAVLQQSERTETETPKRTTAARAAKKWTPRAMRTRAQARATGVIGRLSIPRLNVSGMVAEGVSERTLDRAIGHLPGTSFPGEPGNAALAGHRDTFFRGLARVRRGDRIRVRTADGAFTYRVARAEVVSPRDVQVLSDRKHPTLTLVTCYPFHWIGPAPKRWIVQANLIGPAVAMADDGAPAPVPRAAPAAMKAAPAKASPGRRAGSALARRERLRTVHRHDVDARRLEHPQHQKRDVVLRLGIL